MISHLIDFTNENSLMVNSARFFCWVGQVFMRKVDMFPEFGNFKFWGHRITLKINSNALIVNIIIIYSYINKFAKENTFHHKICVWAENSYTNRHLVKPRVYFHESHKLNELKETIPVKSDCNR